jgi:hypothetical protein
MPGLTLQLMLTCNLTRAGIKRHSVLSITLLHFNQKISEQSVQGKAVVIDLAQNR